MRLVLLGAMAASLAGCVTTLNDIRGREVQDDVVTSRTLAHVRDCLLQTLGTVGRTPLAVGDDNRTEVTFSVGPAGVVFHYTLSSVDEGTRVEARRKNNIADGFGAGRSCYID